MKNIYVVARDKLFDFESKLNDESFPIIDDELPSLKYWCYYAELQSEIIRNIPPYDENKNEIKENIKCLEDLECFSFFVDAHKPEEETIIEIRDYLKRVREKNSLFIKYDL